MQHDWLKRQKFDHPKVHRGMKPQPPFVRPQGATKPNSEAAVHVNPFLIVLPRDAEDKLSLRFTEPFQQIKLFDFRVFRNHRMQGGQNFFDRLDKNRLAVVSLPDNLKNIINMGHSGGSNTNKAFEAIEKRLY